jgi:hypothetical protein
MMLGILHCLLLDMVSRHMHADVPQMSHIWCLNWAMW